MNTGHTPVHCANLDIYEQKDAKGIDCFLPSAPFGMLFNRKCFGVPAGANISATHAILAGHTLESGTCVLNLAGIILQRGARIRKMRHTRKVTRQSGGVRLSAVCTQRQALPAPQVRPLHRR